MKKIWLISDTHFGHGNILRFTRQDGSLLRPFNSIEEHDEHIIQQWNKTVGPQDKVYHLGDFSMNVKFVAKYASRLMGHKRLILGNHDDHHMYFYSNFFEKIYGCRQMFGIIFTHIPVHPDGLEDRFKANVHGHIHHNLIKDKRYFNVSVENINYTPIDLEEILERMKKYE